MKSDDQAPRGPKPEHLKLEGDWEEAVKNALKKPPPPKGATPEGRPKKQEP